ncbi:hypothetical protein QJS10_CPB18g01846 [Acorus calamus]|uniref:Uncharacterized protein n=1 Tax=Acorus calamus TaxID=4465 RepID=A0AAV9CQA6_ACOCL|nr:hypothetical protein QJS10_CPB18g01846 [Acorus calamus]
MEIIKGSGGEADVKSLIKAIKASEVLENRIPLISQLGDLQITEASELASLVECLLVSYRIFVLLSGRLCKNPFQQLSWEFHEVQDMSTSTATLNKGFNHGHQAAGGGTLVSVLNASWKGVVTILQLGKGVLSGSIDIREIILSLISLSVESLRRTAEAWFLKETIDLSEAKRMCLLVKFYLINTVRVASMYPIEAFSIYKEITQCVLIITSLRILLSKETRQRAGSEALYEAVEPTSFCLLNTLLNSTDLVEDKKFEIMDWLFPVEDKTISRHPVQICDTTTNPADEIFSMNCETVSSAGALLLGRFILFLNLLKSSPDSREELVLGISRKLGFLLDAMVNEDVYSSVLVLHTPDLCASVPSVGLNWQPMFDFVLHSLKTFMIVAASNPAWQEVEFFLLKNIIHPHFLCREIITELWCFFIRHANTEVLDSILDTLCSLLKVIALSEPALTPLCSLRKIARTLCDILTSASQCSVDQVYSSITDDYISNPHISSAVYLALLIEGIPLNSLSDQRKRLSTQRIISAYHNSMEKNSKNLEAGTLLGSFCGVVLDLPVVALSAALISRQMESSDIGDTSDSSLLKFTISIIHGYRNSSVTLKDQFSKLLSAALDIIPNMKRLYASDEMSEVIAELHTLFVSDTVTSKETWLDQCKPSLASFMAGLSEMEFTEALSFDVETGNDTNEDSFILEMKAFLEKERALPSATPCVEQLHFLANEGRMLKEKIINTQHIDIEVPESKPMEIDDKIPVKKKQKLPDGFSEGMALLQSGFKVMAML